MALSPNDDEAVAALVEQAKEEGGDHPAFEQLFLLYSDAIYRYLRYMITDDEIAKDLMQDSFVEAWKKLKTLHDPSRFRNWLYQIAENKALNHIRRQRLICWLPLEDANSQAIAGKPEEAMLLQLALAQVQPKYRQCFISQEIEGLSQNEIAEIVGIKKSSVSNYVQRCCEQLRLAYRRLKRLENTLSEREYIL